MLWSCHQLYFPQFILIWFLCSGVAISGTSSLCPASCTCTKSPDKGKKRISCLAGGLTDPIPTGQMDPHIDYLEISAPVENKNWLSVTSIFQHFKQLEELHLTNSNINKITMHAFWGLPSLKVLNLSFNNISTLFDHNFRGLVNLIELNLDRNQISAIASGVFKHLTELKILSLQSNKLKELVPRTFLKLVKLRVLQISGNVFDELDPEAFKDIPDLRNLECRQCNLKRINTQIYHLLPYITHLDLGYNTMQFLARDEFFDLHRLHSLKLDGNMFPVILENTFIKQTQLKFLCLAKNRIAKIPDTALSNLSSLIELDLGYNKLYKVENAAFMHLTNLEKLTLSGNNLNLETVRVIINSLRNLKELNIAHMKIQHLYPTLIPDQIQFLNISYNNITSISSEAFPKDLQTLDLSNNKINGLNQSEINYLESLEIVKLEDNPWMCDLCHISILYSHINKTKNLFRNLTCAFPSGGVLFRRKISKLNFNEIFPCGNKDTSFNKEKNYFDESSKRGLFIGLICILTLGVCSVIFVVISCVQRHRHNLEQRAKRTAEVHQHENNCVDDHHQSVIINNKNQISFQFPLLDLTGRKLNVSTIDEIKCDERAAPGMSNGSVIGITGL